MRKKRRASYLYRPLRGQARSHRYCAHLRSGAVPVGAGVPAKRPEQAIHTVERFSAFATAIQGLFLSSHPLPSSG
ncbi:hypothetical protein EFK07_05015 [Pseudomonas putida]|uniref:Uncharacterized protein n=1 Tax=Pseudomonas putida TaxID=303 RepID=A0A3M8THM2_PSEPU|nr:hypothetical protein EFK07_05015 [Pseudomonas putida]